MKKTFLAFCFLTMCTAAAMACTNFMAGKSATTDGSTLLSYAADSYSLYGALYYQPAADHQPGDMRQVFDWDTGRYLGEIPEAAHTYSVIGNMNEHQLAIGETTWGGRTELTDTTGILDYGSLIYITLQRCKTAREAIRCMTSLVKEYGYYSEGESFSIADPNEVWIMDLIGKGPGKKGAVWVATRIPDDCVSAHANQARITHIDFKDKDNWMWEEDVVNLAREKGWYSGKDKDFSFAEAYNPLDFLGRYGCEGRVWSFFRQVNPEMDKYYAYIIGESDERMPLYIKPAQKVSVQDFKNYMRDQYEGTPLDITQGTDAGPWHTKLRYSGLNFKLDSTSYWYERPTATQQTAWSFVAQMRGYMPDHIGGIFWFGVDDAATNLYVPMYCRCNEVPWCFSQKNGDLYTYSSTSAFWIYNQTANWVYTKYSSMLPDLRAVQAEWENYFNSLIPGTDAAMAEMTPADAQAFMTRFSCTQAEISTAAWRKLYEYLLVKYLDGVQKREQNGQFECNPYGQPKSPLRPALPEDYLRLIAPEVAHE
ncbi:MAG: C69 family dipeptidase [Bacteroides sp.]|nr:C69 family dipeptidase [Bacteroidales bacterium]MCM1069398.1 C69 family dipeptidase [Prevotella sp.]MCM1353918.1 C69 family dipeptidase [Bacteroides sp.]MCM1403182.1 C69 family dipeptidase [Bacteroides sp.]MCM1442832.1 C69 family dipeptidase [Muribaculum sp.]